MDEIKSMLSELTGVVNIGFQDNNKEVKEIKNTLEGMETKCNAEILGMKQEVKILDKL